MLDRLYEGRRPEWESERMKAGTGLVGMPSRIAQTSMSARQSNPGVLGGEKKLNAEA